VSPDILRITDQISPAELNGLVDVLQDGGAIIAAADTVYGLVTRAFDRKAFDRLDRIKGSRALPYVVIFDSVDGFEDWYGDFDSFRRRLISILLPGPVTLILPVNSKTSGDFRYGEAGIGVRVSSDALLQQLGARLGAPLWATSANRSSGPAPVNFDDISQALLEEVEIAVDSGSTIFREPSTVVDMRQRPFRVMREGAGLDRVQQALAEADAPLEILVVCTGNICRSPLAAALLQSQLGPPELSSVRVRSAGTSALEGSPPVQSMIEIASEWGLDLSEHRARQVTEEILRGADLILAAEPIHRDMIVEAAPWLKKRVHLIGGKTGFETLPDPYGAAEDAYRHIAELIRQATEAWALEIRALLEQPV